jgi:DNA-binding beta-propeller fold protein YncE
MAELGPGTVFAGHRIEAVAGRGGMGVVYQATQLALDRTIALKVIAAGLLDDQAVRNRFVRESKVAASIDHPNVIPIYYAGEEHGIAYIAMRYVPGDDVRSLVRRVGPLPHERAAHITAQIGSALDAAHSAGLVHRDIKPANVLLTAEDHVYLTDFGLTKHALSVAGTTKPGHWVGTLDYVAPEQIRGERVDARADVYASGCLLFYMLTGSVPFAREGDEARLWAHLSEPPPKPTELVGGLPTAFDDVIERALAKSPDERYQSAGDLGRAAMAASTGRTPQERERLVAKGAAAPVESETVTAAVKPLTEIKPQHHPEAETLLQPAEKPRRRRQYALLAAALVAAVGIGVGGAVALGLGDEDEPPSQPSAPKKQDGPRVASQITIGERPNVVRIFGDNVFVGSRRQDRLQIVSRRTGEILPDAPKIGAGASDGAFGFGSLWVPLTESNRLVRLDPRTGRPKGNPIAISHPSSVAVAKDAVWVVITPGRGAPDTLVKLDPRTGERLVSVKYPAGIASLATTPDGLWVADRRRARIQSVDLKTGEPNDSTRVGSNDTEDLVYHEGALWAATPEDNQVYKVDLDTHDKISVTVGGRPRQLAIGNGHVYVTNYSSSQLYILDEESGEVLGTPLKLAVNPYSISVEPDGKTLWISSVAQNKLSKVVTDPDA